MKTQRVIAVIVALMLAVPSFTALARGNGEDISPAIDILRKNTKIEKSSEKGAIFSLDELNLEKALGAEIGYISLVTLPDASDGRLCLNGTDVVAGQTVTAASLSKLVFVPTENAQKASFTLKCSAEGWYEVEIPCSIDFSDTVNSSPSISETLLETVSGVCCVASPRLYDPDGDTLTLTALTYPENGNVRIIDNKIYYTPQNGFIGTDKMTVCVSDGYGNTSPEATVTFKVKKNNYSIMFADMKNDAAHAAAVVLAEKSVVTFTYRDGEYYFSPQSTVSRIDMIVMLLTAAGVTPETGLSVSLSFDDVATLSAAKLNYLKKAADMGILRLTDKSFSPDGGVTRMAAAEWLCALLDLNVKKAPAFSDMEGFDEDCKFAAAAVVEAGLMEAPDGCFRPDDVLTKAEAAIALKGMLDKIG